jgi:hypothetical protein
LFAFLIAIAEKENKKKYRSITGRVIKKIEEKSFEKQERQNKATNNYYASCNVQCRAMAQSKLKKKGSLFSSLLLFDFKLYS